MRVAVMIAYRELVSRGISTRVAADLVGIPRATATRKRRIPVVGPAPIPANKIGDSDRRQILDVVNSKPFVDLPPIQIYAQLLDAGTYLCSISTMYRVLNENKQVKDRRIIYVGGYTPSVLTRPTLVNIQRLDSARLHSQQIPTDS
ncbi:hypothetical protein [Cryobacterium sp. Y50]|uniref:hypothetical protein n=1 Tax=Cryobacterium sp. Y50 TaxID=2048286 RepID=UPI0011B088C8|nr:hypothetical protein [Cryobacterium sp. Y50]